MEILEEYKKHHPQEFKGSTSDNDEDDFEEDDGNNEESSGSLTVAFPDWEGSRRKRRRESIWKKHLVNPKMMR
jgi:hypothetical protein